MSISKLDQQVVDEIISAQEQRHMALKNTEITVLRDLLADEFINVHSSGRVEGKNDYLASVASGKTKFVDFSTSNVAVMPYGVTAVVAGELKAHLMHGNEHVHRSFRYASAWVKRSGKWRLTLWQHTTLKPV